MNKYGHQWGMQSKDYSYGKYTSLCCQTRSEIRKIISMITNIHVYVWETRKLYTAGKQMFRNWHRPTSLCPCQLGNSWPILAQLSSYKHMYWHVRRTYWFLILMFINHIIRHISNQIFLKCSYWFIEYCHLYTETYTLCMYVYLATLMKALAALKYAFMFICTNIFWIQWKYSGFLNLFCSYCVKQFSVY